MKCPNCDSDKVIIVKCEARVVGNISYKLTMYQCQTCNMVFTYSKQEIIKPKPPIWSVS